MCYNLKFLLEQALKRAKYYQDDSDIDYMRKELEQFEELYQVSGFSHPEIIIYTNETPYHPELFIWGLIPHWVKNENEWLKPYGKESVGNVPESSDEFVYAVPIYGSS